MIDGGTVLVILGATYVLGMTGVLSWQYVRLRRDGDALRRELEQRYR